MEHKDCSRSLESFLLAVLNRAAVFRARDSLTLDELYELIESGFTHEPAPFDDGWRDQYDRLPVSDDGYAGWRAMLIRQIVDLREMDECGTLENEMWFFGVNSPRDSCWYNLEPFLYIECAMRGFNADVRGECVALLENDGSPTTAPPECLAISMPAVTWVQFATFIACGEGCE